MAKKKLTMNEMVSRSIARRRAEVCEEAVESEVSESLRKIAYAEAKKYFRENSGKIRNILWKQLQKEIDADGKSIVTRLVKDMSSRVG